MVSAGGLLDRVVLYHLSNGQKSKHNMIAILMVHLRSGNAFSSSHNRAIYPLVYNGVALSLHMLTTYFTNASTSVSVSPSVTSTSLHDR